VNFYCTTRRHVPESITLHSRHCEYFKSDILESLLSVGLQSDIKTTFFRGGWGFSYLFHLLHMLNHFENFWVKFYCVFLSLRVLRLSYLLFPAHFLPFLTVLYFPLFVVLPVFSSVCLAPSSSLFLRILKSSVLHS
jgi:hypothetical protein